MIVAAEIAGYFAAHAIWCVADGAELIPMLAYTTADGEKQMMRLAHDDLEEAMRFGKDHLDNNRMDAVDAVLIYDGTMTVKGESFDAILLELRAYGWPEAKIVIGVPYSPSSPGPFAVHKPKLLVKDHCEDFETERLFQAFFEGVESHTEGSKVWMDALDESR